jgi:hypothetical protein
MGTSRNWEIQQLRFRYSGNIHEQDSHLKLAGRDVGMWVTTYIILRLFGIDTQTDIWMVRKFGPINFYKYDFKCIVIIITFLEFRRFEQRQSWPRTMFAKPQWRPHQALKVSDSECHQQLDSLSRGVAELSEARRGMEVFQSPSHPVTNLVTGGSFYTVTPSLVQGSTVHTPKFWGWLMIIYGFIMVCIHQIYVGLHLGMIDICTVFW